MPPRRKRANPAKGDGEVYSQGKQPDTSAKRRKKQEDEAVVKGKDSDVQKDELDNGKTSKGRKERHDKRPKAPSRGDKPLDSVAVKVTKIKAVGSSKTGRNMEKKGTNKSRSNNRPRQEADMSTIEKPVPHFSHCKTPGRVLIMGQGDFGQLGLGESLTERKKPYPVKGELSSKNVVQVKCGGMHTVALTADGKVYTWGCNDEGSLGYSMAEGEVFEPHQVKALDDLNIVQISAGDCHTSALTDNGNVYCWGVFRDSNGPFGMVDSISSVEPQLVYNSSSCNPAVKVVSGDNHVLILTETGTVYSLGSGEQGQLGRVPEVFCSRGGRQGLSLFFTPQNVRLMRKKNTTIPKFIDIFAGSYTSFAVAEEEHSIYAWGLNNYSQLGIGSNGIEFYPIKVPEDWLWTWGMQEQSSVKKKGCLFVAGGMHHTLVCDEGTVYSMGSKNYGRLGLGKINSEPDKPTEITGVKNIVEVACGGSCSFAISRSSDVFSWGMGSALQLGQADEEDYWVPTKITGKNLEGRKVIGVSSGGQHTALLIANEMDL